LIEKKTILKKEEKAVFVSVIQKDQTEEMVDEYLAELAELATTAGLIPIRSFKQKLPHPDMRTYVGKGKLAEIKQFVALKDIDVLVVDDELNGSTIRNIEKELGIKILDRPTLILQIFEKNASTAQAKVQVELAQYLFILPKLKNMWTHLDKQSGASAGSRGTGETQRGVDRFLVKQKVSLLRKKLIEIEKQAITQRKDRGEFIRVSLIGYTNTGKSTLFNLIAKSDVFAENKLFATLDTTTRKIVLEAATPFLLSDTVGFIRKLPHHLIESFKSTLAESLESDILLHVVDISHDNFEDQINVVNKTLQELKAFDKPIITIFNKMDLYKKKYFDEWVSDEVKQDLLLELKNKWNTITNNQAVFISATEKQNIEELRTVILHKVRDMYQIRFPYKTVYYT
jgi:GTP-binding protein HflX